MNRIESRLRKPPDQSHRELNASVERKPAVLSAPAMQSLLPKASAVNSKVVHASIPANTVNQVNCEVPEASDTMLATHDTRDLIDTGATKTVIGSNFVAQFLQGLDPNIRKQVKRCSCEVVFRFGNQGLLKSKHALMVPVCGMGLKIVVVPGSTSFLLSNTLLRALNAMIDTARNKLILPNHNAEVDLQLSAKGLYLIDMNQLASIRASASASSVPAVGETFAQDSFDSPEKSPKDCQPRVLQPSDHQVKACTVMERQQVQVKQVDREHTCHPQSQHVHVKTKGNITQSNETHSHASQNSSSPIVASVQ